LATNKTDSSVILKISPPGLIAKIVLIDTNCTLKVECCLLQNPKLPESTSFTTVKIFEHQYCKHNTAPQADRFSFIVVPAPACPVECEAYSSGVAPEDGTGVNSK